MSSAWEHVYSSQQYANPTSKKHSTSSAQKWRYVTTKVPRPSPTQPESIDFNSIIVFSTLSASKRYPTCRGLHQNRFWSFNYRFFDQGVQCRFQCDHCIQHIISFKMIPNLPGYTSKQILIIQLSIFLIRMFNIDFNVIIVFSTLLASKRYPTCQGIHQNRFWSFNYRFFWSGRSISISMWSLYSARY